MIENMSSFNISLLLLSLLPIRLLRSKNNQTEKKAPQIISIYEEKNDENIISSDYKKPKAQD